MEPVNSTTFIKKPPLSPRGEETLFVARDILLNRLFLGNYVERRHVGEIKDYRDVVTISSAESDLIHDIEKIRHNIYRDCGAKWVGITGPEFKNAPNGYCLWVRLTNIPFGQFWFQIKQIKRENDEIIFRLKCVRPVRFEESESVSKDEKKIVEEKKNCNEAFSEYSFEFDPAQKLATFYAYLNEAVREIRPHITWQNFVLLTKFITAMIIVLVSAMITSVQFVGEFSLRLIRELTLLLQAFTPIALQVIDCITKAIGGLYILIALLFKTRHPPQSQNQIRNSSELSIFPRKSQMSTAILRPNPSNTNVIVPTDWRERNRALKSQFFS